MQWCSVDTLVELGGPCAGGGEPCTRMQVSPLRDFVASVEMTISQVMFGAC